MIEKVESVVRRMRWKALFYEKPELTSMKNTYGFKTNKAPPQMEHLIPFENHLYDMIRNIQFSGRRNAFQRELNRDMTKIKTSTDLLIPADKTTNLYSMKADTYNKLLHDNVTKAYRKSNDSCKNDIDLEGKQIVDNLELTDRMEVFAERDAFITLKDHKDNFSSKPSCRLINPAKSEVGIISKKIVEDINTRLREATGLNQWKNTQSVVQWFKELPNKQNKSFIKFDIVNFYQTISEDLLSKAFTYAKTLVPLSSQDEAIVWHSRKSLLFIDGSAWTKKDGNLFDVTMGSFDGAEICELVGLYILHLLTTKLSKEDVGLYRDDGLAAVQLSGPEADRKRKDITKIFKDCGLKITVEILLKQTDFLDVTFDLPSGHFWPYRKPNNNPLYIKTQSNHPPTIIKHLPKAISHRLSSTSCNREVFERAKPAYKDALQKSGYQDDMDFNTQPEKKKKHRGRNIIWFNPPYNMNVTTNVAKQFLKLVDQYFPRHHRYHKLFNRNNIKCSYSCMPNVGAVINSHNKKVLKPQTNSTVRTCNCNQPQLCPLNGKCLTECVVYKATVTAPQKPTRHYYGLTEGPFKTRYNAHTRSFRAECCKSDTALSSYIWKLKEQDEEHAVTWEIVHKAAPYRCGTRRCDLCLTEKMTIATADPTTMLNRKAEIISTCRHRAKYRYNKVS
jgi:hypothetical protein